MNQSCYESFGSTSLRRIKKTTVNVGVKFRRVYNLLWFHRSLIPTYTSLAGGDEPLPYRESVPSSIRDVQLRKEIQLINVGVRLRRVCTMPPSHRSLIPTYASLAGGVRTARFAPSIMTPPVRVHATLTSQSHSDLRRTGHAGQPSTNDGVSPFCISRVKWRQDL